MFNLIVSGNCNAFRSGKFKINSDRFLEYTDSGIHEEFIDLGSSAIQKLIHLPTLLLHERHCGNSGQVAHLTNIKVNRGLKGFTLFVDYEFTGQSVEYSVIEELSSILGIEDFEFCRSHWAIKSENLYRVLRDISGKHVVAVPQAKIPHIPTPTELGKKVFIVHGHNDEAVHHVARIVEAMGLEPIVLHERPNKGQTIIEKFEVNADVGYAIIIMTGDDLARTRIEEAEGLRKRARQNVILELGYFAAKLGRDRIFVLKEPDVEQPSDIHGVVYVPYTKDGGWKMALAKELRDCGYSIKVEAIL